jgi:hypothetical protein
MNKYSVAYTIHCSGIARHRVTGAAKQVQWDESHTATVEARNAAHAVVIQGKLCDALGQRSTINAVAPLTRII